MEHTHEVLYLGTLGAKQSSAHCLITPLTVATVKSSDVTMRSKDPAILRALSSSTNGLWRSRWEQLFGTESALHREGKSLRLI